ncbi:hypothetical protein VdG2_05297 [Verticillium dahliae VDG2]|nr:hypothetical protein VdG2_05297 [Verticillium dahliae VDG2]
MLPEQGPDTPTEPAPPCPALDPNHEPVTAGLQLDDAGKPAASPPQLQEPSAGAENEWEPDPEVLVLVLQHAAEAPLGTALTGKLQQPAYDRNLLQPASGTAASGE